MMKQGVFATIAAALIATSAQGSDFSALGKPEFARTILLPIQRRQDIACHQLWLNGRRDQELKPVVDEIRRRLAIELGSEQAALEAMPTESLDDGMAIAVTMETNSTTPDAPRIVTQGDPYLKVERCEALATAYAAGGIAQAAPLLAPARDGPIPLPTIGFCLAQLERGPMAKQDPSMLETLAKMRNEAKRSPRIGADERAAIERDYAAHDQVPPLPSNPEVKMIDPELADVICLQGMAELAQKLGWRD